MPRELAGQIEASIGFKARGSWGKHLGVNFLGERATRSSFQPLLDKIKSKLSGLNAKSVPGGKGA